MELLVLPSAVLLQAAPLSASAELLHDLRPVLCQAVALHEAKLLHDVRSLLRQANAAVPRAGAVRLWVLRREIAHVSKPTKNGRGAKWPPRPLLFDC
ncbi:MAG: hypothetical protein K8T25_16910 [Planctomycetia bacterium]|nr:hypothetical protein [Planctomycetia bacterium]